MEPERLVPDIIVGNDVVYGGTQDDEDVPVQADHSVHVTFLEDDWRLVAQALQATNQSAEVFAHEAVMARAAQKVLSLYQQVVDDSEPLKSPRGPKRYLGTISRDPDEPMALPSKTC